MKSLKKVISRLWKSKFLVLIVLLVVGGVIYKVRANATPTQVEQTLITLQRQDLSKELQVSGRVQADEVATLRFQTGGKVSWVGVKPGDEVKRFQAIAKLDTQSIEKQIQKDLNAYQSSRLSLEQNREDNDVASNDLDKYSLSDEVKRLLEQDQLSLNSSVLNVEIAEISRRLATLTSPIDGIVTNMSFSVAGVNISGNDTITVVNPNTLYFEAEVDETDIGSIEVGQKATIELDAFPNQTIESTIAHIDFQSSSGMSGGTVYKVKFELPVDHLDYRLGMNGDVTIVLEHKNQINTIPIEALIQRDDHYFVHVNVNGVSEERAVTIGLETDDYVEITSGLTEHDQIIVPTI